MSATYGVDQVIGKTLFAKTVVPLLRYPSSSAPVIYTVEPGKQVGVVDTFVSQPKFDGFYWSFLDGNNKPFYALHKIGRFDLSALVEQGIKSTQQIIKEQAAANATTTDKIQSLIKWAVIAGGLFYLGKEFISKKL